MSDKTVRSTDVIQNVAFTPANGNPGRCDLEFLRLSRGEIVVICSERLDNTGTSVTNAAEGIATAVCDKFDVPPTCLIWVEHYPLRHCRATGKVLPPTWDLVNFKYERVGEKHFRLVHPKWRHMTADDWYELGLKPRS